MYQEEPYNPFFFVNNKINMTLLDSQESNKTWTIRLNIEQRHKEMQQAVQEIQKKRKQIIDESKH